MSNRLQRARWWLDEIAPSPRPSYIPRRMWLGIQWDSFKATLYNLTLCRVFGHDRNDKMSGSFCNRCFFSLPRLSGNTAWKDEGYGSRRARRPK